MPKNALFFAFAIALAFVRVSTADAQLKPNSHYQQIETAHFRVVYERGLDSLAQHAGRRAELEHARLSAGLIEPPAGKIDLIVVNTADYTNAYATPLPSNRIVLLTRPPVEEPSLQYYGDWIDLVITHELTHIFHMDQAGRFGRGLRSVFGRVPVSWPFFPIVDQPRFILEGLATMIESEHTAAGRVNGSYHEMVVRTDVIENDFDPIDRVAGETPIWPGGARAYVYGSLFMDYIARTYGEHAHTELIRKTAGSILPSSWRMDAIAKKATGKTYRMLYDEWHQVLARAYAARADTLRAQGLTTGETITTTGRSAFFPRVSRDSRKLAYADENGRDAVATRVIDLTSGKDERVRRNGLGPLSWLNGDTFITAQFEYTGRYDVYSDLYMVRDGQEERISDQERAETPDVSPDGARIVYVQNTIGSNRLMVRDVSGTSKRVLVEASPDAQWIYPRFSPDGKRIVAERWTRAHGHDIVVVDEQGAIVQEIRTSGSDGAPAWSADGRYVLFSSDRTGITNLYAAAGDTIRQVTNVLGGAFYPDASPDGKYIYYSGYHADGFHIERIPYDPASWRAPAPDAAPGAFRVDTLRHVAPATPPDTTVSAPKRYSALRSALPHYWLPSAYGDTLLGPFFGLSTAGNDDVERHAYYLSMAIGKDGRVAGDMSYTWAGLANPVINLQALRIWDETGPVTANQYTSYRREDRVSLTASFARPRWRVGSSLVFGVEGVEFNRGVLGPARFTDPQDRLFGFVAGAGVASYRTPQLAISREDGVRASGFIRRRLDMNASDRDASYTELSGSSSAYKSIDLGGFAHHALAARVSGVKRTTIAPGPTDIGGSGGFLPVRGFAGNARVGFSAWTASAEYRLPLALVGRGYKLRPLFLDRAALVFFADAGNASCTDAERAVYLSCPGATGRRTDALVSAGAEISANVAAFWFIPTWVRGGVGVPMKGTTVRKARWYLAIAPSF